MMTWLKLSDPYFQWWQEVSTRYLDMFREQPSFVKDWGGLMNQSMQFNKMADQLMDEMWRHFRLPSRKEVTRLHGRINRLESLLVEIQKRDWAEELDARILKKGTVASPEDLKSLEKTLHELEKRIAGASELGLVKEAVTQMEAKLDSLTDEAERIKEILAQTGSKLDALPPTSKQPAKKSTKRTADAGK